MPAAGRSQESPARESCLVRSGRRRATLIAWGMVPRGEVEIIVAGLALAAGAIGRELYAVIVGMVVITALLVPPLMGGPVRRAEPEACDRE